MNVGEEIVAAYLHYVKHCEFIQQNLYTPDVQGEIDVVGINLKKKELYVCEVAVHLTTGLRYVKDRQPNNVQKLTDKFGKDIEYAKKYFHGYKMNFMLWSPIVKYSGEETKHDQMRDIEQIGSNIRRKHEVEIDFKINDKFSECLADLKRCAAKETKESKSVILRYMQVEHYLNKHLKNIRKKDLLKNQPVAPLERDHSARTG
jgi:hypothetical protein